MDKILKKATIIFIDRSKENYEAISINLKGIYTGKIESDSKEKNGIIISDYRFIPFESVEKIIYLNEKGIEKTSLVKNIKGELKE